METKTAKTLWRKLTLKDTRGVHTQRSLVLGLLTCPSRERGVAAIVGGGTETSSYVTEPSGRWGYTCMTVRRGRAAVVRLLVDKVVVAGW